MSVMDEVALLKQVPLFAKVELKRLKLLAYTNERIAYPAGQTLFSQGERGDSAYVILGGEAEVLVDSGEGPIRVALLERNALVGEIAILCDVPRTATVRAVSNLDTLRITKERFLQLLEEFPRMGQEIMRALALRLEATTGQLTAARARLKAAGLES